MELYIKVSFWIGVVCFLLRTLILSLKSFPITRDVTLGQYVAETMLSLAFTAWAGILIWAH